MPTWVTGIFAITLFVDDLEASKAFYSKVFGAPVVFEDDTSCAYNFGNTVINLVVDSQAPELVEPSTFAPAGLGARSLYTIAVPDVDATFAELSSRGVVFSNGPIDRAWGPRTATFADPAGNFWELATT